PMKCLSIRQPRASLVVLGLSRCELRNWRTAHRGPLAIHASQRLDDEAVEICRRPEIRRWLRAAGFPSPFDLPRGQVLGVVDLVDCQALNADLAEATAAPDPCVGASGRYVWRLAAPRTLAKPVALTAKRGIFDIPELL